MAIPRRCYSHDDCASGFFCSYGLDGRGECMQSSFDGATPSGSTDGCGEGSLGPNEGRTSGGCATSRGGDGGCGSGGGGGGGGGGYGGGGGGGGDSSGEGSSSPGATGAAGSPCVSYCDAHYKANDEVAAGCTEVAHCDKCNECGSEGVCVPLDEAPCSCEEGTPCGDCELCLSDGTCSPDRSEECRECCNASRECDCGKTVTCNECGPKGSEVGELCKRCLERLCEEACEVEFPWCTEGCNCHSDCGLGGTCEPDGTCNYLEEA